MNGRLGGIGRVPARQRVRLVVSAVVLWALIRGVLLGGGVLIPAVWTSVVLVLVVLVIVRVDMRALKEDLLLRNLGVSPAAVRLWVLVPAGTLELLASVGARLSR